MGRPRTHRADSEQGEKPIPCTEISMPIFNVFRSLIESLSSLSLPFSPLSLFLFLSLSLSLSVSLSPPSLLQLDAGVHEKIALYSRDEQSVLVVSYADIKSCLHSTFTEVLAAGQGVANHTHSATAAPRPNKTKKDT